MSRRQKIPHWKQEQHCAHSETQGLEAAQVSQALEETSLSSHPPVPGNLEALAAGTPCSPQSPQKAISSCKLDKSNDSQEREASSASSKYRPDTENLPVGTLDEKATLLVQFLLHKYQMNEPITKADMIDVVIKEYRSDFPEIFKRASEHMELVFGIDVEEVDTSSHSYVLVNKLGLTYDPRLSGDGTMPKTSLLIIVLGVIFMKGNCATEEEIWEVLNMMGLYSGRNHFIFGEPRKFITKDLVQEKYLEYRQVPNSHPPRYEFLWGPRAHAETSKMKLLEFLTKIHQSDPRCFSSQYQEALRDEAERAQARATARASTTAKARASSSAKSSSYPHP
ncbi:melanoma-associated antigen B16-like [Pteropus vampyrus]|uniref:Melanoma-associated antigen B16-like n=1 Tax=Pteropus vampyrus TaxID=132908 RepID=A0A6P3RNV9_PTEVA|nr:melanoma-associated antigen B16-like [Pteropus vampyrus]